MNILEALLTGNVPESLLSRGARQHEGTYPLTLDAEGGYPSEQRVEEITMIAWVDARRWLHDEFPRLWKSLNACGYIEVEETTDIMDKPALRIYVATGGWSGCEEVIEAMLGHFWIRHYLRETRSGGGYTFIVPHEDPKNSRE